MLKVGRIALFIVGMSLSAASSADDAKPSTTRVAALPTVTLSPQAMHDEWDHGSRWQLAHPVETMEYSNDWSGPSVNVDFEDSGVLARVSKLRNLSLLTFAEIGRTRLFLGVDGNGLVGLHFRAFHRVGDERYFEVVRMPYLKKDPPDNETE